LFSLEAITHKEEQEKVRNDWVLLGRMIKGRLPKRKNEQNNNQANADQSEQKHA
jgi:hypothetical protein